MEHIHSSDGSPSSSHQNPKSTAKWAASLENLLEDPEGVKRFREFLKKEFSEENVLFWLACEDFKKTQDKKQMQEKAKEIYMTFLSSKASSQVNVEGQSRLNEKILEEPHPLMFQKLQDQMRVPRGTCPFLEPQIRHNLQLEHRVDIFPCRKANPNQSLPWDLEGGAWLCSWTLYKDAHGWEASLAFLTESSTSSCLQEWIPRRRR
ncbi:regulator of G-protein signaling 10 isoform X1 [Acinonyx jubatus]|uniref:Regulator of G-protein signaling 10 isoform X1 n=1 Tax=Acinonyx jubatus TaxID=32536 RepID=A0ABM3NUA7_ACIJB|nr:regulator of G-protein signaling 10 isoform X1 [Acinonyx jubatus]